MTKDELRKALEEGKQLDELFEFTDGQECQIFKAKCVAHFAGNHEIVYIPDTDLNEIDTDRVLASMPEIECVLMFCFTGHDFFEICGCNEKMARRVFDACDWQCPDTEYDEQQREEEEDPETQETAEISEGEALIAPLRRHLFSAVGGYEMLGYHQEAKTLRTVIEAMDGFVEHGKLTPPNDPAKENESALGAAAEIKAYCLKHRKTGCRSTCIFDKENKHSPLCPLYGSPIGWDGFGGKENGRKKNR